VSAGAVASESEGLRPSAPTMRPVGSASLIEIQVPIAECAVACDDARLVTIGLGSCVAIALHARAHRAGGLAHIMLPHAALSTDHSRPGKFAGTAVPHMLEQLRELGVTGAFEARLIGGASMFEQLLPVGSVPLGSRNLVAARAACAAAGIPVVAEDSGGGHGRSVYFDVHDGTLLVRSVAHGDRTL
jgi:chemotaxis protein CheD